MASAIAKAIEGGNAPDLIMFGTTYDGRDVAARLSVALDKPVLTNNVDIEVDGDAVVVTEPVFGGTKLVKTKFTGRRPVHRPVRPKSFVAAEESGGGAGRGRDPRGPPTRHRQGARTATSRSAPGPKLDEANIVVSGGRGLGEAGKYEMIEQLAKLLKAAPGRPGPSSTPAGCPTATRWARPARS